ncbi:MAG: polysaccharide deacetylase family protein [Candidatus Binatia bacterium]
MSATTTRLPRAGAWAMKRLAFHSGLLTLARYTRQYTRALVLRYHAVTPGVADVAYAGPEICLSAEAFRLQAAYLKRAYSVIPLDELVRALAEGRRLPPRAIAITFDDGYADNHTQAFPILRRLGLTATVYLTTGSVDGGTPLWMSAVRAVVLGAPGRELAVPKLGPFALGSNGRGDAVRAFTRALVPLASSARAERIRAAATAAGVDLGRALRDTMLTWVQVRELAAAGWTIGAHTVTHANVALASLAEAEAEIAASRDAIRAQIGRPVEHFAYTNSGASHRYFSNEVGDVLRRLAFRSGVTSQAGVVRPGVDPYLMPRIGVGPRLAPVIDFAAALERRRLAA